MKLTRNFYERSAVIVAKELLGKYLVRIFENKGQGKTKIDGKIIETEAYLGEKDLACHASKGKTPRTEVMFGPPGYAYIYLIYGMYYCFNVVTDKEGFASAVLLRGVSLTDESKERFNLYKPIDGPGKLCRAFKITNDFNGIDICGDTLFFEDRGEKVKKIYSSPRIGVDYAGIWAKKKLRFYI